MTGQQPFLKRVSGSEHGGWPLFCRLLLWATRNNQACARQQAERGLKATRPGTGLRLGQPEKA